MPLAAETGISIVPWSPLASGFLTGKYRREGGKLVGAGCVSEYQDSGNPTLEKFSKHERNWAVLDAVRKAAQQLGRTEAEVALAWVIGRPQVTSVLIGATRKDQLEKNLAALALALPPEIERNLTETSRPESNELDHFFEPALQGMVHGGTRVLRGIA